MNGKNNPSESDRDIPRRRWLTRRRLLKLAGATLASGLALGGYAWLIEPHWVKIVRRTMPLVNLPETLIGRTLVQISDLHVGPVVDSDYLIAALGKVAALAPDLLVITGDFMSCVSDEQVDHVARVLEHLPQARLGCFACLGNHDYGCGWRNPAVAERLCGRLTDLGVITLRNSCRTVEGLQLAGIDDLWGPAFHPGQVLPRLNPEQPAVVLCHNPDAVDLPCWSGFRGWVLAGHTHGGQCKPPFLPPPMLPVKNRRYTAGVFDVGEGRALYINPGLGYLRRVRCNVRPEITVFQLQRAA
jgi:predicted MPP superfamily phosphohydrolase